jgi:predicted dehydrogenase
MKQLRYGILSTSSIAPRFIAAVREAKAGDIVALSSRTLEKAREKAELWDIPTAYGNHEELLDDPNVDIVYISTVNSRHFRWAMAALEAGKHVVCEKPCTMSAAQTSELFAIARDRKCFLMEAEKMLFLPAVQELKRRIDAGELGQIRMVEMSHSFAADYNAWMFNESLGGGVLLSSGIYAVQLLLWLCGPIARISGLRSCGPEGTERQYILTGETESGVLFSAKNSTQAALDNTARFYGTKGWAELPEYWKARSVTFHTDGVETLEFPCKHELIYEAQHIKGCISQGLLTSPVVTEDLSVSGIAALERVKETW